MSALALTDEERGFALAAEVALDACDTYLLGVEARAEAHRWVACSLATHAAAVYDGVPTHGLTSALHAAYMAGPRPGAAFA